MEFIEFVELLLFNAQEKPTELIELHKLYKL
jgi:hypothetical protein